MTCRIRILSLHHDESLSHAALHFEVLPTTTTAALAAGGTDELLPPVQALPRALIASGKTAVRRPRTANGGTAGGEGGGASLAETTPATPEVDDDEVDDDGINYNPFADDDDDAPFEASAGFLAPCPVVCVASRLGGRCQNKNRATAIRPFRGRARRARRERVFFSRLPQRSASRPDWAGGVKKVCAIRSEGALDDAHGDFFYDDEGGGDETIAVALTAAAGGGARGGAAAPALASASLPPAANAIEVAAVARAGAGAGVSAAAGGPQLKTVGRITYEDDMYIYTYITKNRSILISSLFEFARLAIVHNRIGWYL